MLILIMAGLKISWLMEVCLLFWGYLRFGFILNYFKDLTDFPYPIIDDENRTLAVKLNMLDKDEIGAKGLPLTCRAVFIIDSTKKFRLSLLYPATTGRNFE